MYEKIVQPLDGHSITGEYIPALHGFGGNVQASLPELSFPIDARVLATLNQPSSEFQYNNDTVGGDQIVLGVGYVQNSSREGTRSSAYTGYYLAAAARQNFVILTSATVLKLVQTGTTANGLKSFRSVQYAHGTLTLTVTATREVILSAGAINTPQILQLSGIGNAVDLRKLNITVLINNPAVGSNLYDHTLLPNIFVVQDAVANQTFDDLLRNQAQIEDQVNLWIANRTGLFINNIVNHFGFSWIMLDPGEEDPAPGPNSPHYEMIFANLFFEKPGPFRPDEGSYFTVGTMLTSPESTGTVKLASEDPLAPPIIDPRYLTEVFDIIAMRESVKAVLRFTAAPAWSDWIAGRFGAAFQNATDDASIDAYVRTLTISDMNLVGTASMSMVDDPSGVVGPDLLVHCAHAVTRRRNECNEVHNLEEFKWKR
ncbi:Pyranose dehydrogenase 3 [Psilocybe cubensis]|uniref:pyranose dehydrogenase (acceptor) n=2 Tax=Psilocybe cubensis TaxID=181762 RepID=A0A8H7XT27_PSICU|nr:Pyranose dehydrogenase 3 [Psilocybe cubensis]KAH9475792.1 Pyranose dehydrogenase 3 [Psilocybe cubensis]